MKIYEWDKLQKLDKRGYKASSEAPKELKEQVSIIKEIFSGAKIVARKIYDKEL
jgi:hypothetical protein